MVERISAAQGALKNPEVKVKMYGLVRDCYGKPRIDGNPADLHPSIKDALTTEEYETAVKEWENRDGKTRQG